jgi:hypothetical protein
MRKFLSYKNNTRVYIIYRIQSKEINKRTCGRVVAWIDCYGEVMGSKPVDDNFVIFLHI